MAPRSIGEWLTSGRERLELSQEKLADQSGVTLDYLQKIEKGRRTPDVPYLVAIWRVLFAGEDSGREILLAMIVRAERERMERQIAADVSSARAEQDAASDHDRILTRGEEQQGRERKLRASVVDEFCRVDDETQAALSRVPPKRGPLTLADFGSSFLPLAIVAGDRRERSPKTLGDTLAWSAALPDFMFLPELGLDANLARSGQIRIYSDKVFVDFSREELEQEFGRRHLLVIGSVAANYLSRFVDGGALFPFTARPQLSRWLEHHHRLRDFLDRELPPGTNRTDRLHAFQRVAYGVQRAFAELMPLAGARDDWRSKLPKAVANAYKLPQEEVEELQKIGLQMLDGQPIDDYLQDMRGREVRDFITPLRLTHPSGDAPYDYASLSLARNPFTPKDAKKPTVAILAAGLHGPGTAIAVRALANAAQFAGYPAGGVLQVRLDMDSKWTEKIRDAQVNWQTKEYTYAEAIARLDRVLATDPWKRDEAFASISDDDIRARRDFLGVLNSWHDCAE